MIPDYLDTPPGNYTSPIWEARVDHAMILRALGLTYDAIGERLGVTRERVRQMVAKRERQLRFASRRLAINKALRIAQGRARKKKPRRDLNATARRGN